MAQPAAAAPHDRRTRRRRSLLLAAGIGVPITVAVIVVVQLLVVRSANPDTPQQGATTIAVKGTLEIFDTAGAGMSNDGYGGCTGTGGFSDIKEGAEVVVSSEQGTTLATTFLSKGVGSPGTSFTPCVFTFAVTIASSTGPDTIAIAHVARTSFPQAQMASPLMTLGTNNS